MWKEFLLTNTARFTPHRGCEEQGKLSTPPCGEKNLVNTGPNAVFNINFPYCY
jgi:hypothetical protein